MCKEPAPQQTNKKEVAYLEEFVGKTLQPVPLLQHLNKKVGGSYRKAILMNETDMPEGRLPPWSTRAEEDTRRS
jgi:hypothetical protein